MGGKESAGLAGGPCARAQRVHERPEPPEGAHLQHFVDGFAVHGLLVVGGLVESAAEGAQRHQLLHTHLGDDTALVFLPHSSPTTCLAAARVGGIRTRSAPVLERTRCVNK